MAILSKDEQRKFLEKLAKTSDTIDPLRIARRVGIHFLNDVKPTMEVDPEFKLAIENFFERIYWEMMEDLYHAARKHDGYDIHLQSARLLLNILRNGAMFKPMKDDPDIAKEKINGSIGEEPGEGLEIKGRRRLPNPMRAELQMWNQGEKIEELRSELEDTSEEPSEV